MLIYQDIPIIHFIFDPNLTKNINLFIYETIFIKEPPYKINRKQLKEDIQNALDWCTKPTEFSMIAYLLSKGFISNNSSTQLSAIKKIIKPSENTMYIINIETINSYLGNICYLSSNPTLESFNKP